MPVAPHRGQDMDMNHHYELSLVPMQLSGTGVMTRRAWVTNISPVNLPSGVTLRAITATDKFHVNRRDQLMSPSTTSLTISGSTTLSTGALRGDPIFVAENVSIEDAAAMTVDMSWTCGASVQTVPKSRGYVFRPADIGCTGIQKLVLRYDSSPNRVTLEQYGDPSIAVVEPTTTTSLGQAITFERGSLALDATLISHTTNAAVLKIDSLSWNGAALCTAGTYTLPAE